MVSQVKRFAFVRSTRFNENESGVREWSEQYFAETTESLGAITAIRRHRPDLQRWQPHREDPEAVVRSFHVETRKHSLLHDITVEYSTAVEEEEENPLTKPAAIELGGSQQSMPIIREADGKFLTNTAGKLMEGETDEGSFISFSVTKNIGNWPAWLLTYRNAVNSDTVRIKGLICPPRTLKIAGLTIGAEQQFDDDTFFSELRMELIHNEETWDRFYLNRGFEEVVLTGKVHEGREVKQFVIRRCMNGSDYVSEPCFLDNDGRRPRIDPKTQQLVTLEDEIRVFNDGGIKALGAFQRRLQIKEPLDREDIIILRKQIKQPKPFSVLPIR